MDCDESNNELWGWQEEDYCLQREPRLDISHCLWEELNQNEDDLSYMLEEQTPIKDCAEFGYHISDNGDKTNKVLEESRESSQLKRRRMLKFNSNATDIGIVNEQLTSAFVKSKAREGSLMEDEMTEDMRWVSGFSDDGSIFSHEGLDQLSEGWLASCFNESEMHFNPDAMNASGSSDDHADISECCNVPPLEMESVTIPETVTPTPSSKFKGRKSYMRTPTKMTSSVAYPFALIKPCGVQGDLTLKDINQRIRAPLLSKSKHAKDDSPSHCYPTSAFSGKPVVVKTKIRTEGGKGSITIMRTKG